LNIRVNELDKDMREYEKCNELNVIKIVNLELFDWEVVELLGLKIEYIIWMEWVKVFNMKEL